MAATRPFVAISGAVALAASLVLAFVPTPPGCGLAWKCAELARWGRVPLVGWPWAFLGTAYFAGILASCAVSVPPRWVVRAGAIVAVGLIAFMGFIGSWCPYCLASHIAMIAILIARERLRVNPSSRAAMPVFAAAFIAVTAALAIVMAVRQAELRSRARTERELFVSQAPPAAAGFTGRYRLGPEVAAVRIVFFGDFQCPDCLRVEAEVLSAARTRGDASVSFKHFPFCSGCNPRVPRTLHPNACTAARAAEAAGILGGGPGTEGGAATYWAMHGWIVERKGSFTRDELIAGAAGLGLDGARLSGLIDDPRTLEPIHADVEEAMGLGLHFTPMVFINGVEFKSWPVPGEVAAAIAGLPALGPGSPSADRPPGAREKYLADWREQPRRPSPARAWTWGDGGVEAVLFGDYEEPFTRRADAELRALAASGRVRYTFRHYPVHRDCNPTTTLTLHTNACAAARAAEAARMIAGTDGFRGLHEGLMAGDLSSLAGIIAGVGLSPGKVLELAATDDVGRLVAGDAAAARGLGLGSIPMIFIDGRPVPRWLLGDESLLAPMVQDASENPAR